MIIISDWRNMVNLVWKWDVRSLATELAGRKGLDNTNVHVQERVCDLRWLTLRFTPHSVSMLTSKHTTKTKKYSVQWPWSFLHWYNRSRFLAFEMQISFYFLFKNFFFVLCLRVRLTLVQFVIGYYLRLFAMQVFVTSLNDMLPIGNTGSFITVCDEFFFLTLKNGLP